LFPIIVSSNITQETRKLPATIAEYETPTIKVGVSKLIKEQDLSSLVQKFKV